MTAQDAPLAEALWARSQKFAQKGQYYDALLDVGAAHRLLSLCGDPRAHEVHLLWAEFYTKYHHGESQQTTHDPQSVSRLEGLLKQIHERRSNRS